MAASDGQLFRQSSSRVGATSAFPIPSAPSSSSARVAASSKSGISAPLIASAALTHGASAQAAVDSAAMAAALQAYETAGPSAPYTSKCGVSLVCAVTPVNCPGSMNLTSGCMYAQQNGFAMGGHGGQQAVTMADNAEFPPSAPPTAPGTSVYYWVTARAVRRRSRMPARSRTSSAEWSNS